MVDIESLLTQTDAFINTMYAVREDFGLEPTKEHIGTCINYQDLLEMRQAFVEELVGSVGTYVYSPAKQKQLVDLFVREGRDISAAWRRVHARARAKFRPSNLQGQFSELLLHNLLQHYFRAAPLVRKMAITTNPAMERNGADAIHIATEGGKYRLYLGEAKTYDRKIGGLKAALADAILDLVEKHYPIHTKELNLYTYEDFVPAELEEVARQYQSGALSDVEVHLVCIVAYDEKTSIAGTSRDELLDGVVSILRQQLNDIRKAAFLARVPAALRPRLTFIVFPVWAMHALIEMFEKELGRG